MIPATCCPDRPHYAFGECRRCYDRSNRGRFPSEKPDYRRARYDAEKRRRYQLKKNFGLTVAQYDEMLREQGGGCAVCGGEPGGRWKNFAVDHDHETGAVRGLLCLACNRAIGLLEDDSSRIRKIADYLERVRN